MGTDTCSSIRHSLSIRSMIRQFTGQENILAIPRVFIEFTGDHITALLLNQILYWSDRTTDPDGWFYKTAAEWKDELCISPYQLSRAMKSLKELGIKTKLQKVNGAPCTHYSVDFEVFEKSFSQFLENERDRFTRNSQIDLRETHKTMDLEETRKSLMYTETTIDYMQRESRVVAAAPPPLQEKPVKKIDPVFEAFVEACGWSLDLLSGNQRMRINVALKKLRSVRQPTAEHVASVVKWFTKNDWRGKKGESPTPEMLVQFWDKATPVQPDLDEDYWDPTWAPPYRPDPLAPTPEQVSARREEWRAYYEAAKARPLHSVERAA